MPAYFEKSKRCCFVSMLVVSMVKLTLSTQRIFTCSKRIGTLEQGVKYVQS